MVSGKNNPIELNSETANLVFSAIAKTFSLVLGVDLRLDETFFEIVDIPERSVTGVIGLVQETVEGTLSIGFSREVAFLLLSEFYKEPLIEVDDRVIGGVGELANMVYGIVKEDLNRHGYDLQMCLPLVVLGQESRLLAPPSRSSMVLCLSCRFGPIWVELHRYDDAKAA